MATIAIQHLGLKLDDPALSTLPKSFRDLVNRLDLPSGPEPMEW